MNIIVDVAKRVAEFILVVSGCCEKRLFCSGGSKSRSGILGYQSACLDVFG